MEWLLRRNFWIVKLFAAAMVSLFLASTATTLLAMWLFDRSGSAASTDDATDADDDEDDVEDAALASATPRAKPWRDPEKIGAAILGRNVFCPECRPEDADPIAQGEPPPTGAFDRAPRTSLPLTLSATMEATDPEHSLATIHNGAGGYRGLFAVGDSLGDGVQIVAISAGRVDIVNAGRAEYIPFGSAPPPPPPAAAEPKPAAKADKPTSAIPGAEDAIKCDSGSCQVERELIESLIAKPQLLVGQGMARPAKTQAGDDGFRLSGVKKGSLPDLLGLKTGDIITEVGGQPLTYDALMQLYPKMRNAKHIEVTIDRRGERISRALEIVS